MALNDYHKKRKFKQTPEPKGKVKHSKSKKLEFVVQKHQANQLHYDLRLEMNGVLKSWAVPKGPSLDPHVRHLAVKVEDHPFEYRKFEGMIPEGNYGGGNVIIWDSGAYEPRVETDDSEKTLLAELKKGHITFILHGQKLKGEFALIRSEHIGKNNWLLIKKGDKYAATRDVTKENTSVVSGKTVEEIGDGEDVDIKKAPGVAMPSHVKPMLATLTEAAFDDPNWIYEIKWDGYRTLAAWDGKRVDLYSRNGLDFSKKYPAIAEAVRSIKPRVVLDGEIVAADKSGRSHFGWLQNYGTAPQGELLYYAFDILWCDGRDLVGLPLLQRKKVLQSLIPQQSLIRYSDHVGAKGKAFFAAAKRKSLEGIMAKLANSTYQVGKRSRDWLKIKTHMRQEVVIGGFTEPKGSRQFIGALIVGVYEKGKLVYAGHVGGGIPPNQLEPLRKKLLSLERKVFPFAAEPKPNGEVHWVAPKLVCEIKFGEWTSEGQMRQPIFVGLRNDKPAKAVKRELPKRRYFE